MTLLAEERPYRSAPPRWTPSPPLWGAAIFVAYLVPAVVGFWGTWSTHPTSVAIGAGAGDSAEYTWALAWTPWALLHGHNLLISHWVNVPFGVNLGDNISLVALALAAAPVTAAWGPVVSLSVVWTLAFPLSALSAYALARRFVTWRPAAFVAGLVYGFSPYMVAQGAGHLNLVFVPLPPLIFLVAHELVVRQRGSALRWGLILGALVVAQFFISSEVLATTALFAALSVVVACVVGWRRVGAHLPHAMIGLAATAALAGIVLAYPLEVAFAGPQHITGAISGFRYYYSALFAPLLPSSFVALSVAHLRHLGEQIGGNGVENGTYLGLPLVVVVLIAPLLVRRREAGVAALMALVAFVASLGTRLHFGIPSLDNVPRPMSLPAKLWSHLPVLDQAFPVRYSLYVVLFASVVLAVSLEALHGRPRHGHRRSQAWTWGLPAVLAVVVAVPLVRRWPYNDQGRVGVPPYFTSAASKALPAGGVALVYPLSTNTANQAEEWQAEAGFRFKMPGGYFVLPAASGTGQEFVAPTLTEVTLSALFSGPPPARTPLLRSRLRAQLRSWKVRSVIVQPVGNAPVGFFTWLVGRPPSASAGGVEVWYHTTWP